MKVYAMLAGIMLVAGAAQAESVKWQTDYNKAVAKAKEDKKIVMVDVYTDWCGWCKKLDKDVYNNAKVSEKLSKDFIAVKINPEKSVQNRQLDDKFGARGYPHIVFVNGDGKKIDELIGYPCGRCTANEAADKFAAKLDDVVSKAK